MKKPNLKFKILLILLFFCFYVKAETLNDNFDMIQKNIVSENQKTEMQIETKKKEVNELISAQLFDKASIQINEIRTLTSKLGSSEYVKKQLKSIDGLEENLYKEWSTYLENKAEASSSNKKWDDSLKYAKDSISKLDKQNISSPQTVEKNKEIIEKAEHNLGKENYEKETAMETLVPDYDQEKIDIEKYFILAETYKKGSEYEKARDMLEKILVLEPYNYKATYELKQIYEKIDKAADKRKYMQMKERLSQAEWGYTFPIKTKIPKKDIIQTTETKVTTSNLERKLEEIILPKVEFNAAPLSAVIEYIRKESEIYDKKDNLGINLDLRITAAPVIDNTESIENEDQLEGESEEPAETQSIEDTPITMHLTNIPLGALIKLVCSYANLHYRIGKYSVIISDIPMENMILKYIPLKSDIVNSISVINNFEITEDADIESVEELSDDKSKMTAVEITDEEIKTFFLTRGVPFPEGSTISWDMASGTLITKNTPENIKILTNLLHDIDINMPLVLVEVKFIELTYNKDQGLAFNWKINLDNNVFSLNEPGGNDYLNQTGDLLSMLEFSQNPINIGNAIGALDFVAYALEQTSIGETLSSPKIITKSGSTAIFEMVEKNYYATSWETTDPEVVYETVQISPPTPEFEEFKLGIILQVTPTVSPNKKTVFLDIYPTVKTFQKYDDTFQYSVTNVNTSLNQDTENLASFVSRDLLMPIILERDIKSKLKINDGETVVLGGMLMDQTVSTSDKYPFFGDVPLVGRFFRSEYETVEQQNLLIFVTAKLVNPDGSLLHKPKPRGLFEFKNI